MNANKQQVSDEYLSIFCRELHQLIKSGMSISMGLELLIEDEKDPKVKEWLQGLHITTSNGATLTEALKESKIFPDYMVDLMGLAEYTGRLEDVLLTLQHHYDRKLMMKEEIRGAITVPLALLVVMVAVVILLITKVLPIFDRTFSQLGVRMGNVAGSMMKAGEVLTSVSAFFIAVFLAILYLALMIAILPPLRNWFVKFFTYHFGGKGILGTLASSKFASAMAMAVAGGLSIDESIDMAEKLCKGSKAMDAKIAKCRKAIDEGETTANALSMAEIFSNRDSQLLKLAENTGSLADALEDVANRLEAEGLNKVNHIVAIIEPVVVMITGTLAGSVLLSVMLPLMGLLSGMG